MRKKYNFNKFFLYPEMPGLGIGENGRDPGLQSLVTRVTSQRVDVMLIANSMLNYRRVTNSAVDASF